MYPEPHLVCVCVCVCVCGGEIQRWIGYDDTDTKHAPDCWTLVSTPGFAFNEIKTTTMQDEATGAFKPQEDGYLNTVPGQAR